MGLNDTPKKGWVEFPVDRVPDQPAQNGLIRFKISDRWFRGTTPKRAWYNVPYIDKIGQIHATSVGTWKCRAPQLLATITSTVFKRLRGNVRHINRKRRVCNDLLYQVAQYYAITNEDSFFRRCVEMISRSRSTELRRFVYFKTHHLGTSNRFLFDQVRFASLWFQSRTDRCPLREMPTRFKNDRDSGPLRLEGTEARRFAEAMYTWALVYQGPSAHLVGDYPLSVRSEGLSPFRGKIATRPPVSKSWS